VQAHTCDSELKPSESVQGYDVTTLEHRVPVTIVLQRRRLEIQLAVMDYCETINRAHLDEHAKRPSYHKQISVRSGKILIYRTRPLLTADRPRSSHPQ
jgi:hypothetical protein